MATGRALVAPDSWKGTFSAGEVAQALARGLVAEGWTVDRCPLGDGGEGTAEALLEQRKGSWITERAHDPLGRPVDASFALFTNPRVAMVEVASASGLSLVDEAERDAEAASTYGTGELIVAAARLAELVMVAVGGTATTDGGAGALEAIDAAGGVEGRHLVCLCDVQTPWEQAARIFGPQKGADAAAVGRLEGRLEAMAETLPRDPRGVRRTGAGGASAGGLWAALGAELVSGAAWLLDAVDFDQRVRNADMVVTGEGCLDQTTAEGKVVREVAPRSTLAGRPVHAVVGQDASTAADRSVLGLTSVREATTVAEIEAVAREIAAGG
jgi:glycerate 2-kinase